MDKREAIINTAAQLIHQYGYTKVGLKMILDELNIPKGSFYHYFKSKDDLGLAIIDLYIEDTTLAIGAVSNDLDGLGQFFDLFFQRLISLEMKRGCPVGNLILELSDVNELFLNKLHQWYDLVYQWSAGILDQAQIPNSDQKAKALFAAFEGTMLTSKVDKNMEHFQIFQSIILPAIIDYDGQSAGS